MGRRNEEVGAFFDEYADLLSITGGDAYKVRAYAQAARAIASYHEDVDRLDLAQLCRIPNAGKAIAEKIVEFVRTGRVRAVEAVRSKIPPGVRELTTVSTLGPRKAMLLHELLGISSVPELHVDVAMDLAEWIVAELSTIDGCFRCAYAGSLRRLWETIGNVDVLAAAEDASPLMDAFAALPVAGQGDRQGDHGDLDQDGRGLRVELRVVSPQSWARRCCASPEPRNTTSRFRSWPGAPA